MRWVVLWALAGCGRVGFDARLDAAAADVPADAAPWAGWTSMYAGTWTVEGTSVHAIVDSSVGGYYIAPFTRTPPVTVTMTFRIHAREPVLTDIGNHNIGAMDGFDVAARDGQRCGWGEVGTNMYADALDHMIGTDNDTATATLIAFPDGLVLESTYTATLVHDATTTCTLGVAGGTGPIVATHAPYAGSGTIAIRVRGLDVSIDSLTVTP